jgi:acylphosphatase
MQRLLLIQGRVQGVGYRASFAEQAESLGLSGWVRNRRDGSVEALVQGASTEVETIITWSRHGPPAARVSQVTVMETTLSANPGFAILPTQ